MGKSLFSNTFIFEKHNNFFSKYVSLCLKHRNNCYEKGMHRHHVNPTCFQFNKKPLNSKNNLIYVSVEIHIKLHVLLSQAFPKHNGLAKAQILLQHFLNEKDTSLTPDVSNYLSKSKSFLEFWKSQYSFEELNELKTSNALQYRKLQNVFFRKWNKGLRYPIKSKSSDNKKSINKKSKFEFTDDFITSVYSSRSNTILHL